MLEEAPGVVDGQESSVGSSLLMLLISPLVAVITFDEVEWESIHSCDLHPMMQMYILIVSIWEALAVR